MKLVSILPLFTALLLSCTYALAETAVIIHPSNADNLDKGEISKIFLGKSKKFPSGETAMPVNLNDSDATRTAFDSNILNKDAGQLKAYWAKLVFTGKASPPKKVGSAAEAKTLVANNPNTIAYIPADQVDDTVKTVLTF